jgi:hypothetical protein
MTLHTAKSLVLTILVGVLMPSCSPAVSQPADAKPDPTIAELKAEVERLKSIAPTQSHVMADTAIQFSSLWFAAERKNWPLATFYFNETRGRIRWTIRINPKPKVAGGEELVDLQGVFDGIDESVLTPLKQSIDKKDSVEFVKAYKLTIEACYACHKSGGRPFLRPMIPTVPPQSVINADPNANWPL